MVAAAWALIAVMGSSLNVAPDLVADAVSKLLGVGVVIGILAYFVVRGEPVYRKARGYWVGVLVILLGVAPALFLTQRVEQRREAGKVNAIVWSSASLTTASPGARASRVRPSPRFRPPPPRSRSSLRSSVSFALRPRCANPSRCR